jgi:hypothetical protein
MTISLTTIANSPPKWPWPAPYIDGNFRALAKWIGYAEPFINPMQPPFNAQGNGADDALALNAAFNYAAQNNIAVFLPTVFKSSTAITVNQQGNVICAGYGPQSGVEFTSAGTDAGFNLTLRAYDGTTGTIDRVQLQDFFIYAGAVHTSPAVQMTYTSHVASAEISVVIRNLKVTCQGVFGTKQFLRGLSFSNCYNWFVDTYTFIGSTTQNAVGLYFNNCISGRHNNTDISWCGHPVHITTGDGGIAQPQCEGLYFFEPIWYVNADTFLIDGLSSVANDAIDIVVVGGAIQPANVATPALEWNLVAQFRITGTIFYAPPGHVSDAAHFISCLEGTISDCEFIGDGATGSGTTGVKLTASSALINLLGNQIAGYDTGISFDNTTVSNQYGQNTIVTCTTPVSDAGTTNIDLLNVVLGGAAAFQNLTGPSPQPTYTVTGLPTPTRTGVTAYATNARNAGEGAGTGTGSIVAWSGSIWRIPGISTAVTS